MVVALGALLALLTPAAHADPFLFKDLTSCCTLAGSNTTFSGATLAAAVNDEGDVAGTATGSDGYRHGFVLKNGQFTLLGILSTDNTNETPFSAATDINDNDFVVGASSDGEVSRNPFGGERAVGWQPFSGASDPTAPFDFGQLEADTVNNCNYTTGPLDCYTSASDVNASNDVTGYGEFLENPDGNYCWCLFPWVVPGGSRALAQGSGDTPSTDMLVYDHQLASYRTTGINATDQVVVSPDPSTPSNGNTSAIYPGDVHIPFDAGADGAALVRHAINDSGWVVGADDSTGLAKVSENGTVVTLPPLSGDTQSAATAINNLGDVVGSSTGTSGCPRAVEWPHGNYNTPIDLNAVEMTADETMLYANAISNNGTIVGQGGACMSGSYTANIDPWELIPQQLSVSDVSLNEPATGTTSTANFTVTLSSASSNPVTVAYSTADGSATGDTQPNTGDYTSTSGTLTFTPGQTSKSVPVTVNGSGFFGNRTFTLNLSNPTGAVISNGTGTARILGPSPLAVTVTVDPSDVTVKQTAAGPTPVDATVSVTVKNTSNQPIDDVTLPSDLTIGWHAPASGATVPVKETDSPDPEDLDLGTLAAGKTSAPSDYEVEVDDDGSLDVQALVTGSLQSVPVQALGTTLFEPETQPLVFTAKLGAYVHSDTHPGWIKAGTHFLVNLTVENRSSYQKVAIDPIYPTLAGNASGGDVVDPAIQLDPGQKQDYVVVVRTTGSDAFAPNGTGGGTRASITFDTPSAYTVDDDNQTTKIDDDDIVIVPGSSDLEEHVDDSPPATAPFSKLDAVWSVSKGVLWGLWNTTWGLVRGIAWDLPSLALKGTYYTFKGISEIPSVSLYYMDQLAETYTACAAVPGCLDEFEQVVDAKVEAAYAEAPYLLGDSASAITTAVNGALTSHFSALSREWYAGDWQAALQEFTTEGTETAANVALLLGPAVLSRFPKAAAAFDAAKTATYAKVGDALATVGRALEPAKAAVLALSDVVKPGFWFNEEQMASIFGVSDRESSLLSALTERLGISVVLRSRASESIKFLEEGLAVLKPYWIKTKNVSWLDTQALGYPDSQIGKVAIRPPVSLEQCEANMLKNNFTRDSVEWNEGLARRLTRIKEYNGELKQMQKWNKAGKVKGKWPWGDNGVNPNLQADTYSTVNFRLHTEDGSLIPQIFSEGRWKFITGDIDLIAITKADGSALSDAEHVAYLKQLANILGAQHPESATWINDGKFWFKAKESYLTNDGACCLAQYGPDGRIRAVQFNQKLSDPTTWTKLKYRIYWNGGYQAGPGG